MTSTQQPKRHQWEDALLEAERQGAIPAGAANLCLRLATAINWSPRSKTRDRPALYWKNEDALKHVGSSRATYHRYRAALFEARLLADYKGNLVPLIPSQVETEESQGETEESQVETGQSQNEHPFPVDPFPVDPFPEDRFPEDPFPEVPDPTAEGWEPERTETGLWIAKTDEDLQLLLDPVGEVPEPGIYDERPVTVRREFYGYRVWKPGANVTY